MALYRLCYRAVVSRHSAALCGDLLLVVPGVAAALIGLAIAGGVAVLLARLSPRLWNDADVRVVRLWQIYLVLLSVVVGATSAFGMAASWLEWIGYGFGILCLFYVVYWLSITMHPSYDWSERR